MSFTKNQSLKRHKKSIHEKIRISETEMDVIDDIKSKSKIFGSNFESIENENEGNEGSEEFFGKSGTK